MNIDAIDRAILVMQRVKENEAHLGRPLLDMQFWQQHGYTNAIASTSEVEVLNSCGTTCCFAGWLAVAPEFPELVPDTGGCPVWVENGVPSSIFHSARALTRLFEISNMQVVSLIYTKRAMTVDDVIATLESWKVTPPTSQEG